MKRYTTFINEIGHYPTPIKQIYDIIEEFCFDELNKYLKSKGKFYNHNITKNFDWYDIKDKLVDMEQFKKFPVEEIIIKFSINVKKDSPKQSYSSGYQPLYKYNKDVVTSRLKPAQSKLVKKAIVLVIEIGLQINKYAKSIEPELFSTYIKANLTHELTHAYQDYQQNIKKVKFTNAWDTMYQLSNTNWISVAETVKLNNFIWLIYKTSLPELNADIAAGINQWNKDIEELISIINDYDPEEYYNQIITELEEEKFDIEDVEKNFGINFTNMYLTACKQEKIEPDPKVLKLKDKDMKYILNYWNKIFKKRLEYIKNKLKLKEIEQ